MTRLLIAITLVAGIVFTLAPSIDLAVSRAFFDGTGFWAANSTPLNQFRDILYGMIFAMLLIALISLGFGAIGHPIWAVPTKVWGFISAMILLGPGLVVNTMLKGNWGRARPDVITDFGGTLNFTPALIPSDQCPSNCSFVSGEGAGATALFIAILVLLPYAVPARWHRPVLAAAGLICTAGIALRVIMGRHFLSDAVFAVLFTSLIALILHRLILGTRRAA